MLESHECPRSLSCLSIHWIDGFDPRHWTLESLLRQGQSSPAVESAPFLMGEEAPAALAALTALALIFRVSTARNTSNHRKIPMKIQEAMGNPTWDPKIKRV